jgi:hypothetical protein
MGARNVRVVIVSMSLAAVCSCQRSCKSGPQSADEGAAATSPGAASTDIGIAECDDYLVKYRQCIDEKIPNDRKKAFLDALERTHASWLTLATNPGARPGLPQVCQISLQTAQSVTRKYDCVW